MKSGALHSQSTMMMNNQGVASFTMEELMRRIRRIEKLTERMAQGKFEEIGGKSGSSKNK